MEKRYLLILPTYNERDNAPSLIKTLFEKYPFLSILVIDDSSPDFTLEAIQALSPTYSNLHWMSRPQKKGLGSAYKEGFKWGLKENFDFFIEMDADFSHDPEELKLLLEKSSEYDFIVGSRFCGGIRIINWPFRRLLLSTLASFYTRMITRMPIMDPTSGFVCVHKKVLQSLNVDALVSSGYSFQIEFKFKSWTKGHSFKEVPIIFYERKLGHSKMNWRITFEALLAVPKLKLQQLLRLI